MEDRTALLRMFDAAANRCLEGLRVLEDGVRFGQDDAFLTAELKRLRHAVARAAEQVSPVERLRSRETLQDVGTDIRTAREAHRPDLGAILAANFARSQEALRSLAEASKSLAPSLAEEFEQSRYRLYTLQRAVHIAATSRERLRVARLYVLVDGGTDAFAFAERIKRLVAAGVHLLQLRDKHLSDRDLLGRARIARDITAGHDTLFIMNDRADVAAAAHADGVHVGQDELPVHAVRQIVGEAPLVGVSTHNLAQARQAVLDGADYIGVGPTFASPTKSFDRLAGVELVRSVYAEIGLPAFAIGGITTENLPRLMRVGCRRVAVQSAVSDAPDAAAAITELLGQLNSAED